MVERDISGAKTLETVSSVYGQVNTENVFFCLYTFELCYYPQMITINKVQANDNWMIVNKILTPLTHHSFPGVLEVLLLIFLMLFVLNESHFLERCKSINLFILEDSGFNFWMEKRSGRYCEVVEASTIYCKLVCLHLCFCYVGCFLSASDSFTFTSSCSYVDWSNIAVLYIWTKQRSSEDAKTAQSPKNILIYFSIFYTMLHMFLKFIFQIIIYFKKIRNTLSMN